MLLDNRPKVRQLDHFSHYLAEFEYTKFDEVEVPGQYFLLKNNNKDFVKIQRFEPTVDLVRGHLSCSRRIHIRGVDGHIRSFIVQHPAARHCRREERIIQLFRILNSLLERKKETRRRGLAFHLPIIIPLAPQIRLVEDDVSYKTLQDIFEQHCRHAGFNPSEPSLYYTEKMKKVLLSEDLSKKSKMELLNLKVELFEEVAAKFIPETILSRYCQQQVQSYQDLWLFRKAFIRQMACSTFLTYALSIGHRYPQKMFISMKTGKIWLSELLPSKIFLVFFSKKNWNFFY